MLTIFRLTVREVLNKKIFLIAGLLSAVFLLLFGTLLYFAVQGINSVPAASLQKALLLPQLYSMGLYFGAFLANLFAIFISVGAISAEVESGVMQAIVPKPIHRGEIVLGKYLGYGVIILLFGSTLYGIITALLKVQAGYLAQNIGWGLLSFLVAPVVLLTLTVAFSTFLSTMANGIAVIMFYIIGTVGGMVEAIGGILKNTVLISIGITSSLLIPTDAAYRKMISVLLSTNSPIDAVSMTPFGAANPPSNAMAVYTGIYIIVFLFLAIFIFSKKDI